ncbi:MAG: class I SAM-dependent methyltransferase [Pseudomonadota bacterium]
MSHVDFAPARPRPELENRYWICDQAAQIHGWLEPVTARRTTDILHWQGARGISGNLMEIGVMCGKYFSILLDSAERRGNTVLGIDTFQYTNTARVDQEMTKVFGEAIKARYDLWECMSSKVNAAQIIASIGHPRFISIDGAHDYENVYRDLCLADAILAVDGLVAADDFLNPLTLGVNQAVNAFLSQPRHIVPVAFIANKLFLAHRTQAACYRDAIEEIFTNATDAQGAGFVERASHGRHHIEQPFHGHSVLIG